MKDNRIGRIVAMNVEELASLIRDVLPTSNAVSRAVKMATLAELLQLSDVQFFELVREDESFVDELLSEIAMKMRVD